MSNELPVKLQQVALQPQQWSFYHGLKSVKRRKEYCFSRLLLNLIIQTHLPSISLARSYQDTDTGPRLNNTDYHISISHSHGVIAVAVASEPVGIDIEHIQPRKNLVELANMFMAPEELDGFLGAGMESRLFSFYEEWSSKEAIFKSLERKHQYGLGLSDIRQIDFVRSGNLIRTTSCLNNQFVLSVALRAEGFSY